MTDSAQTAAEPALQALADAFDGTRAMATVETLCLPGMSGRSLGSVGHDQATQLLAETLGNLGLNPRLHTFPVAEVMRLQTAPECTLISGDTHRSLVHRAEFAEHPRSGPMPEPVTGTVVPLRGQSRQRAWIALEQVPQGEEFVRLATRLGEAGAVGVLAPQQADGSGFLTKRVTGPPPVGLPVVAVRPDLLREATGATLTAFVPLTRQPATGTNIIATLPGARPEARPILLTAHYDGVGSDPGLHFPCAGDNASGSAVLCEVARVLTAAPPLPRPVVFALVDGEELGTLGSRQHAKQLSAQGCVPDVLNVDMAGKFNGKIAVELGPRDPSPDALIGALDRAGRRFGIPLYAAPVASDNRSYAAAGFPAAGIGLGAAHYHSPLDAVDRVELSALRKAGLLLLAAVHHLAQSAPPVTTASEE